MNRFQDSDCGMTGRLNRTAEKRLVMELKDFMDLKVLQDIQDQFSEATGLAAIAVDNNGNYMTKESNFRDFCTRYTRSSKEGLRRCTKCDREGKGTYRCHAGLMDFSVDIVVNGEKLGALIGGQVLPEEPDLNKISRLANELGINENEYVDAIRRVPVRSEKVINAAAALLGEVINRVVNMEYIRHRDSKRVNTLNEELAKTTNMVGDINDKTKALEKIASKQNILALNASIEAGRAGALGAGFAVVASQMGDLSKQSGVIYKDIQKLASDIYASVQKMNSGKE